MNQIALDNRLTYFDIPQKATNIARLVGLIYIVSTIYSHNPLENQFANILTTTAAAFAAYSRLGVKAVLDISGEAAGILVEKSITGTNRAIESMQNLGRTLIRGTIILEDLV